MSATFTDDGPLGLRFVPNEDADYTVEILAIADDTQRHYRRLCPGLCLTHIAGGDVGGLGYTTVLQMLKRAGRPLQLSFRTGGAVQMLALATHPGRSSLLDSVCVGSTSSSSRYHNSSSDIIDIESGSSSNRFLPTAQRQETTQKLQQVSQPSIATSRTCTASRLRDHRDTAALVSVESAAPARNSTIRRDRRAADSAAAATELSVDEQSVQLSESEDVETAIIRSAIGAMKDLSAVLLMHEGQKLTAHLAAR